MHWGRAVEHNLERTLHHIGEAVARQSCVVVLPEASLAGYCFPYVVGLDPARCWTSVAWPE